MPVNLKELNRAPKGGIYALAPHIPKNPNTKFSIKVGRTIDFKTRLNSYHLCFNAGFRVIALLPLKNSTPEEQRKSRTMQLEKLAGELLGKSRSYANRETRGSEWYDTTVLNIKSIFNEVHGTIGTILNLDNMISPKHLYSILMIIILIFST